jgi:guanosine-3',5'-bis(diphosphate) 3'-pyrophosphohydrolase
VSEPAEMKRHFQSLLAPYPQKERQEILRAVDWSEQLHRDQKRASGEPFFVHPLKVAETLIHLRLDHKTIVAALLHDVLEDTSGTREQLQERFGKEAESLVEGVTKITLLRAKSKSVQSAETIRKMLFAMVKDIRVILIKLADKLHNMRTLEHLEPERSRRIAAECLDIYSPLAGRLGISWIKDELEDLAMKSLFPDAYEQIKRYVSQKRSERVEYLERIKEAIYRAAAKEGVDVEITTRIKHFYSIFQKMKKRVKQLDEIYDLLGIRILCSTTVECYTLLGLVHELWKPLTGRFKDYIAMPKSNRYQSLHTTVMAYDGRLIEIQIRTKEMNQTAEYGIAAHWLYKTRSAKKRPEDLTIISKLRSWDSGLREGGDFLREIKDELLRDSIYVFTPKGDVIELPKGATPIDFAYHIHTEIGNHLQAAKADGHIVQLRRALRNTQVIEIVTSPKSRPHLSWLRFAKTHRARSKIRQWLNRHDESLIIDRSIVVRKSEESIRILERDRKLLERDRKLLERDQKPDRGVCPPEKGQGMRVLDTTRVGIRAGKERNIMIRIAGCCSPSTGDRIAGYISRGRGIIIHREDCPNLRYIKDFDVRNIEVEWETVSPRATRRFRVTAREAADIFSEIEGALKKYEGHLISGKLHPNSKGTLTGYFTVEIRRTEQFRKVLKDLRTIPAIINIQPARNYG